VKVWATVAATALAALLVAAPAIAAPSHTSGPLSVSVEEQPFALSFTDSGSGEELRTLELGGSPASDLSRYGPLGFSFDLRVPILNNAYLGYYVAAEAPTVWFHATRVLSAEPYPDGIDLLAATNDPLGHRLAIRIETAAEGAIRVRSRVTGPLAEQAGLSGAAFETVGGERFIGLGERSNAADQTGNEVFNWAEEGPFSAGTFDEFFRENVPDFTFPTGPTASNFPIPWTISTRGIGFLIEQYERSRFRFASERADAWQAETEASEFAFVVFAGPEPAGVLRRYSAFAGRQPAPSPWIFGPWFQATLESEPYELIRLWREQDVPVTVAQTYTHYLPCGVHRGREAEERARIKAHHALGYKITTYFNPHVCTDYQPLYDEMAAAGELVSNGAGEPYVLSNPFTADERVSEIDFTNPAGEQRFGSLLDEAIDAGYDGWMEDFGEYTPTDSRFANGKDGLSMHNRYPVLYHGSSYRHTKQRMGKDAAVFVRSGYHGSQPFSRIVWGGDPSEDFSCTDGLCAAVHQALSMGASGVGYWGSDIGGFHAIASRRAEDELTIRWLQFGAVSGVMRTQANGLSLFFDRAERSQVWHSEVLPIWRRYAKLRTQLLPYIEAASRRYQETGMPITRQLALVYPDDPAALRSEEELMFGPDLFVAPVLKEGARERSFHLPEGKWVDLWRSVSYREGRGVLRPGLPELIEGGGEVTLPAPLEEMPILARAGTILPLLSPEVDTLANVGRGPELVSRAERADQLRLLAFPRGRSRAALGARGFASSRELAGERWRLRIADAGRRSYSLEAALGTLKRPFAPCVVTLDGEELPDRAWAYAVDRRVLSARFATAGGTLATRGRC